jgi:hypothetical protein
MLLGLSQSEFCNNHPNPVTAGFLTHLWDDEEGARLEVSHLGLVLAAQWVPVGVTSTRQASVTSTVGALALFPFSVERPSQARLWSSLRPRRTRVSGGSY